MAQQANVQAVGAWCHYSMFSTAGRMGSPLSTAWYYGSLGTQLSKPEVWQGQASHIWKHSFVRGKYGGDLGAIGKYSKTD